MKMRYRGVEYARCSLILNLEKQQKEALHRRLANAPTVQMKFLGQFFDKQLFSLAITKKNLKFMGRNNSDCSVVNPSKVDAIA